MYEYYHIMMSKENRERLREKIYKRAALLDEVEDCNIQILAIVGQIKYLDTEIKWLTEEKINIQDDDKFSKIIFPRQKK